MAEDVFISYCHENKEAARILADAIIAKGYSVWWDKDLATGDSYTEVIEKALDAAKAIIVIWSEHSRKSFWVRDEAAVGRDRNRLLPIAIDGSSPPLGFRQIQTIDLQGWDGRDAERIAPLFRGLNGLMGRQQAAPASNAAATSSSPFGASAQAPALEATKGGKVLAGVNAAPNNKPLKQILREEKKQRTFFRTYFWTSFLLSGVLAGISALVLPQLVPDLKMTSNAITDQLGSYLGYGIAMFVFVGIGLFLGRAFIIIGRRLSKRKSIRYFDSTTLIVMALSVVGAAGIGAAGGFQNDPNQAVSETIAASGIIGVSLLFPMFAFFSIPVGFFRGLGRTTYADGA